MNLFLLLFMPIRLYEFGLFICEFAYMGMPVSI